MCAYHWFAWLKQEVGQTKWLWETFKWQDHASLQRKINEAKANVTALKASISSVGLESKLSESKWKSFFRRSPLEELEMVITKNTYDKGIIHNLAEVAFPLSSSFLRAKAKSR